MIVTNYFKDNVLISKSGNEAVFYIREKTKPEKIEKYIVEPYLHSKRINHFKIKILSPDIEEIRIGKKLYHLE